MYVRGPIHRFRILAAGVSSVLACVVATADLPNAEVDRPHSPAGTRLGIRSSPSGAIALPESNVVSEKGVLVGLTAPFHKITLASVMPARITTIPAAEGSMIRQGEVLVALDESVQQAKVRIAKAAAETTLEIGLARAAWERAHRNMERLQGLRGEDSASSKEWSDASTEAEMRRLEYELAKFNHEQAALSYERELAVLEQHRLRAPFDGYVVEHLRHPGEAVNEMEGILTLHQLNPLLVVVDCPAASVAGVREGDPVIVRSVSGAGLRREGRVYLVSRAMDAASQTVRVKVRVDNQDQGWKAGMKVMVEFGEPGRGARAEDVAR